MGDVLGPGWVRNIPAGLWYRGDVEVDLDAFFVYGPDHSCSTPEATVAVAHLLAAAEEVAAGGPPPRLCSDDCTTEQEMAYALGRDEERARVLAYLRTWGYFVVANEIERGEHWAGHECGRPEAEAPDVG